MVGAGDGALRAEREYIELRHRTSWIAVAFLLLVPLNLVYFFGGALFFEPPVRFDPPIWMSVWWGLVHGLVVIGALGALRTPFGVYCASDNSLILINQFTRVERRYPSSRHHGRLVAEGSRIAFVGPTGYRQVLVRQVFVKDDGFIAAHDAILEADL